MAQPKEQGARAAFTTGKDGGVCITFFDPAYVRAEVIILDSDGSLHAVLHESSHLIGHVGPQLAGSFAVRREVLLAAMHADGHELRLTAPLVLTSGVLH